MSGFWKRMISKAVLAPQIVKSDIAFTADSERWDGCVTLGAAMPVNVNSTLKTCSAARSGRVVTLELHYATEYEAIAGYDVLCASLRSGIAVMTCRLNGSQQVPEQAR